MNQREAYERGKSMGWAATENLDDEALRWASDKLGYGDPDALDKGELEEVAQRAAYEGVADMQDSSSFENFALNINWSGNRMVGLWEKYEDGVRIGINQAIRECGSGRFPCAWKPAFRQRYPGLR